MNPPEEQPPSQALPALQPSRRPPWDIHPALSEDRLRAFVLLLAHARRDAVRLAAYDMGDDSWSVGCRAYAFGRQRLRRAAERGTYNWLTVLDESHHFVFLIEDVPVRFYRGSADDPTTRTLRRQAVEAQQLALALGEERPRAWSSASRSRLRPLQASSASCSWPCAGMRGRSSASGRCRSSYRRLVRSVLSRFSCACLVMRPKA